MPLAGTSQSLGGVENRETAQPEVILKDGLRCSENQRPLQVQIILKRNGSGKVFAPQEQRMSTLAIPGWRPPEEVAWASEGSQLPRLRVDRLGRIKGDTWASGGLAHGWCYQPPKPTCAPQFVSSREKCRQAQE